MGTRWRPTIFAVSSKKGLVDGDQGRCSNLVSRHHWPATVLYLATSAQSYPILPSPFDSSDFLSNVYSPARIVERPTDSIYVVEFAEQVRTLIVASNSFRF